MDWRRKLRGFYAVLDRDDPALARDLLATARVLQVRFKGASRKDVLAAASWARRLCDERGALLVVNDDLDAALESGADAVHLGQDDLPLAEARRRAARQAPCRRLDPRRGPGRARGRRRGRLPRFRPHLRDADQGQPGPGAGRGRPGRRRPRGGRASPSSPSAASRRSARPSWPRPAPTPRAPSRRSTGRRIRSRPAVASRRRSASCSASRERPSDRPQLWHFFLSPEAFLRVASRALARLTRSERGHFFTSRP